MTIQADENGIKNVPAGKSWRLIYNGGRIIELSERDGASQTGGDTEVFVTATKAECEVEISRLGLV